MDRIESFKNLERDKAKETMQHRLQAIKPFSHNSDTFIETRTSWLLDHFGTFLEYPFSDNRELNIFKMSHLIIMVIKNGLPKS